MLSDPNWQKF
uniref:WNK1 n=1 Tax=Arundo donax TaxID=35708 RepID=A0A0A9E8G3_ARUDO